MQYVWQSDCTDQHSEVERSRPSQPAWAGTPVQVSPGGGCGRRCTGAGGWWGPAGRWSAWSRTSAARWRWSPHPSGCTPGNGGSGQKRSINYHLQPMTAISLFLSLRVWRERIMGGDVLEVWVWQSGCRSTWWCPPVGTASFCESWVHQGGGWWAPSRPHIGSTSALALRNCPADTPVSEEGKWSRKTLNNSTGCSLFVTKS